MDVLHPVGKDVVIISNTYFFALERSNQAEGLSSDAVRLLFGPVVQQPDSAAALPALICLWSRLAMAVVATTGTTGAVLMVVVLFCLILDR